MINIIKGDLLTAKGYILHQVNCRGSMGAGVAKAIKKKWPIVFEEYMRVMTPVSGNASFTEVVRLRMFGKCQVVDTDKADPEAPQVVNLFSQWNYGRSASRYTSYDKLDSALAQFVSLYLATQPFEKVVINFPLIGCGLGGAHWPIVREIIEHRLPDDICIKNLYILP